MSFILGSDAEKNSKKSVKSLLSHIRNEKGPELKEVVYLIINTKIQLTKSKDYTPRIIPITNKLDKLEDKSVLLVTKDPSTPYRQALNEKNSPTEDVFNQIFTLTKLKGIARDPKKVLKLFKDYDLVVADNRVHKFLPGILGAQFYVKNKKIPFMVQMAKPDVNAQLTKGKKNPSKLKDDRCEPVYVKLQMKSIVKNTSFLPPVNGNCMSIRVGYTNWKPEEIVTNVNDVLKYLIESKYQPVGGLLKTVKNIQSIHVKTSESISLPIWKAKTEGQEEEDDDSDFEF